jgi:hypothetical protein
VEKLGLVLGDLEGDADAAVDTLLGGRISLPGLKATVEAIGQDFTFEMTAGTPDPDDPGDGVPPAEGIRAAGLTIEEVVVLDWLRAGSKDARIILDAVSKDEPVFVFRAHDSLGVSVLGYYERECEDAGCPAEQIVGVEQRAEQFAAWAVDNPEAMKLPDA